MSLFNYLFGWRSLDIAPGDLVLEVGSGHHPYARSDIVLDKFLADNRERNVGGHSKLLVADRPLVCGDAQALPFLDKSFDYLICSHLIEHLDDPVAFLQEAMRVNSKGFIRCPSGLSERLFGSGYHKYIFDHVADRLEITQKNKHNWGQFGQTFHQAYLQDGEFRRFVSNRPDLFEVRLEWNAAINFRFTSVTDPLSVRQLMHASLHGETHSNPGGRFNLLGGGGREGLARFLRSLFGRMVRRVHGRRTRPALVSLLACPVCHFKVESRGATHLICNVCGRTYAIREGIPIMLVEQAEFEPSPHE